MLKIVLKYITILLSVALILGLCAHFFASNALESKLRKSLPENAQLKLGAIQTNIFTGNLSLHAIQLEIFEKTGSKLEFQIDIDAIHLLEISYFKALFGKCFSAESLLIRKPLVTQYIRAHTESDNPKDEPTGTNTSDWNLAIEEIVLSDGNIELIDSVDGFHDRLIYGLQVQLNDFSIAADSVGTSLPAQFNLATLAFDSLSTDMSRFERLSVGPSRFQDGELMLADLNLWTPMTRRELLDSCKMEREHINLLIPNIKATGMQFGFMSDTPMLTADDISFSHMDLEVHLDKAAIERTEYRPLYSQSLRDLNLKLDISRLSIDSSSVSYEERLDDTREVARIHFDNLSAQIDEFHNLNSSKTETLLEIQSNFMGASPMVLYWRYQINNPSDGFSAALNLRHLDMSSVSRFFQTYANAKPEGELDHLFFEIQGDDDSSSGTMKLDYQALRFDILRKNRPGVAPLKTTLGNWLLANDSKKSEDGYRYGSITVEREKNKSFFNFLWLNARNGLKSTLMGDGEIKEIETK